MMPRNEVTPQYVEDRTIVLSESGCWIWMLSTTKGGYGKMSVDGKSRIAHREVWKAKNGDVPDGLLLCHRCDTPSCVNPDHLFLGTHADNAMDMVSKGRAAKGARVFLTKLTEEKVRQIRSMSGSSKSIAKQMGVCEASVWNVKNRVTWRHVI